MSICFTWSVEPRGSSLLHNLRNVLKFERVM
jgi:hypothetical protein